MNSVFLCLFVSSHYFSLSLSLCPFHCLCVCFSAPVSVTVCVCLSVSVCCHWLCESLCVCPGYQSLYICHCLCVSVTSCLSQSLSLYACLYLCVCVGLSLSLSLSLSFSLSLYIYMHLSIYLSQPFHARVGYDTRSIFLAEFEFSFHSSWPAAILRLQNSVYLTIYHSW